MNKSQQFLQIFCPAQKKYSPSTKRLSGEGWKKPWQTLLATILSAQSRDEITIPTAKKFFKKFPTLNKITKARLSSIKTQLSSINYYKTKSKNIKATSKILLKKYKSKVPDKIEELIKLPGVGRKTANLILNEIHNQQTITVDTHVHRISNVLGLVKTKTPHQTEIQLMRIAPKKYWSKINRIFVLWGKDVPGRNKKKLLEKIN